MNRAALILLCLAVLRAQDTPSCTAAVTVTDATSGAPVQGATLILGPSRTTVLEAVTDVLGNYKLQIPRGVYTVTAAAKSYSRQSRELRCFGTDNEIRFSLSPEAVISGRVTADDGSPLAGAALTLLRTVYVAGEKRLVDAGGAVAGDDGQYRLDNLSPGTYYVIANPPPGMKPAADGMGLVATFYPSATEASSAAPLRIRGAGEMGGSDIRMVKMRSVVVTGTLFSGGVTDDVRNYTITLTPHDLAGYAPNVTVRDEKGRFQFRGVLPGSYTLATRAPGQGTLSARRQIEVGDRDLPDVALTLTRGAHALITFHSGEKEQHAVDAAYVALAPWDAVASAYVAEQNADGFLKTGLPLGLYRIILGIRNGYGKALRVDGHDAPDWIIDLSAPGKHQIDIEVGFDFGTVTGYVRDGSGNPAGKMLVTLAPKDSSPLTSPRYAVVMSDEHGRFAFQRIAPGEYKVYAWENAPPGLVQNRTVLHQFEIQGTDVQVQPGVAVNADATVISASATAALQ